MAKQRVAGHHIGDSLTLVPLVAGSRRRGPALFEERRHTLDQCRDNLTEWDIGKSKQQQGGIGTQP